MTNKKNKQVIKKEQKITVDYIVKVISKIMLDLDLTIDKVNVSKLTDTDGRLTDWELRKFGGLSSIKKSHFPTEKNLDVIHQQKGINKYIQTLEDKVGELEYLSKQIGDAISKNIKPVKVKSYKRREKIRKSDIKTDMVAMLNDLHIGLIVDPKEVNYLNTFNFEIASRRIAFFIDEVCNFKKYKRDSVGKLHLILNGDLIGGIIHGLLGRDYELLTHQFNGAVHIFVHAIARLSEEYPEVVVYLSTGNHGELPSRREGGHRVISQVYDSIEGQIFYAVSAAHKNTKNVSFVASHGLYQDVELPAGRAVACHGHIMLSKALGNPGKTINSKALSVAVTDLNNSEIRQKRDPIKLILLGHTHCHFHMTTGDGVQIYNAPSLSGIDSFAYSIGINHNLTGQLMFESTEKHVFGDSRLLKVQEADNDSKYDKIIPPYTHDLVYKG